MNSDIHSLSLVPEHLRDFQWEESFLKALPKDFVQVTNDTPVNGPDSWPYMYCETSSDAKEPALKLIEWLSDKGIGLAINPQKQAPDFVLSYGMVWNFRERGEFLSAVQAQGAQVNHLVLDAGQGVMAGDASDKYLPTYARNILRQFFMDQGVKAPRILVVSPDRENFDLCFSVESLGHPPESEHKGILEAISWFLPSHYRLALLSEKGLPGFFAL